MDTPSDITLLACEKYGGDTSKIPTNEIQRLAAGEPLAYVIGTIPFLGLDLSLSSRPLIPRPETEWWTEQLIIRLRERFGDSPFSLLDLCAGSGCIGLAIQKAFPHAAVYFAEIDPAHCLLIATNAKRNGIPVPNDRIFQSDMFTNIPTLLPFDCVATNPPYVPQGRILPHTVSAYEPALALYAGNDGLDAIRAITHNVARHVHTGSVIWIECDSSHAPQVMTLCTDAGAMRATILADQYGRDRIVLAFW